MEKRKKNGGYKEYFEDGKLKFSSAMKNNDLDGITIIYHPEGTMWMKGIYKNGLREGTWNIFKADGSKETDEVYKNGNLIGPKKPEVKQ